MLGEGFEVLVRGDHLVHLLHGDFAVGGEGGGSDGASLFVLNRGDGWHEIRHSVNVWHNFCYWWTNFFCVF